MLKASYSSRTMDPMDEQQACQRLLEGGYFVALGVPPGVEFGIDLKSYQVLPVILVLLLLVIRTCWRLTRNVRSVPVALSYVRAPRSAQTEMHLSVSSHDARLALNWSSSELRVTTVYGSSSRTD